MKSLLALLALASVVHAAPLEVKLPKRRPIAFMVDLRARRLARFEIWLNGIPAMARHETVTKTSSSVQMFGSVDSSILEPGRNTVEVRPLPDATTSDTDKPNDAADETFLEIKLADVALPGESPEVDDHLVWKWTLDKTPPNNVTQTFTLPASGWPIGQLWSKADVITTITPDDEKAITALVKAMDDAMAKGDLATVQKLQAFRLQVASDGGPEVREQLDKMIRFTTSPAARSMMPKSTIAGPGTFQLLANRVVLVRFPIKETPGKKALPKGERWVPTSEEKAFVAKLGGAWSFVGGNPD